MSAIEDTRPNSIPLEQWKAAVAEARHILISRAIAYEYTQRDVTYTDFVEIFLTLRLGTPRHPYLPKLLEAVSTTEHEQGRPMLSVMVVGKKNKRPGGAFYALAHGLGRCVEDEEQFFASEHRRVTEYWKKQR